MLKNTFIHPEIFFSTISIGSSILLFFLLVFKYRNRGGLSFALVSLSMAVWQFGKLIKNSQLVFGFDIDFKIWADISFVGATFIYPTFYRMCCRISFRDKGIFLYLSWFGYITAVLFSYLEFAGLLTSGDRITQYGYYHDTSSLYVVYFLIYSTYMIMGMFILYPSNFPNIPHLKKQAQAIFLGALFGFSLGSLEFIGVFSEPIFPVADISPFVFGCVLYWAIYRFNIMEGGDVLKTVIIQIGYLGILFIIIYIIFYLTQYILFLFPFRFNMELYKISLYTGLLFILTPLYIFLVKSVRKRFYPVRFSYRNLYSSISEKLSQTVDQENMINIAIEQLEKKLGFENGTAILFEYGEIDFDYNRYHLIGNKSLPALKPGFFENNRPGIIISRNHILVELRFGFKIESEKYKAMNQIKLLNRLKADLLIPLTNRSKLIGILKFNQPRFRPERWEVVNNILSNISNLLGNFLFQSILLKTQIAKDHLSQVGMMSATLAHEIKNPLEGIYGAAQIVRENDDQDQSKFVDIILKDAERLNDIVRRFLQFSSPYVPTFSIINLKSYIEQFIMKQNSLSNQNLIQLTIDGNLPPVQSDQEGLEHILINLVQNARKFHIGKEPIRFFVINGKKWVTLSIEDRGPGVPEEKKNLIFSPFYSSSTTGTGLGLSISKKIANAIGGELYLEPLPVGARFTLKLNQIQ